MLSPVSDSHLFAHPLKLVGSQQRLNTAGNFFCTQCLDKITVYGQNRMEEKYCNLISRKVNFRQIRKT